MSKQILFEDRRSDLVARSKRAQKEKDGKTRYQKRVKSRVSSSTKTYNRIDMNKLFKDNIMVVDIEVHGETDDYKVRISFGGFLDKLYKELKRKPDMKLELRDIIRAIVICFNNEDVYIHCTCLHPSTKIKLLDGTSPTVKELKERFDSGEKLYAYSVDDKGDFKPGEIENVWISGSAKEFIKITLDNDKEIITTPEHPYLNRQGIYVEARDLKTDDDLKFHKIKSIGYVNLDDTPIYDITVKDYSNFLVDSGVILHNCDDWKYRMAYWATLDEINSGDPELIPSDETNPDNTLGPGCKHSLLVLSNTSWIIKVASVINNYVKYMEQHMQKLYAEIIYPAIYKKQYEEPVQLTIDDTEEETELDDNEETINKSNEEGRTRGQFKQGNKQGIRFTPNKDKDQITIDDIEENGEEK